MTASGGDPRVLAAAARISDAHTSLDAVGRRVAAEQLSDYPALATDPRLPGPVLVDPGLVHRRTAQLLTTAGGDDLHDAAERLAGWAEPVVALPALQQQLDVWLPASAVAAQAAALTRRLLCDAAGLARTPWFTHSNSTRPKTRRPAHTHQPSGHPAPTADPTSPSVDSGLEPVGFHVAPLEGAQPPSVVAVHDDLAVGQAPRLCWHGDLPAHGAVARFGDLDPVGRAPAGR